VGRLFVEFGWVMASAVAISTFVALTACPALASKLLSPRRPRGPDASPPPERFVQRLYRALLLRAVRMPLVVLAIAVAVTGGAWPLYDGLQRELAPREDRGVAFVPLTAPQGSTLAHTDIAARQVERIVEPLHKSGDIATIFTFTGSRGRAFRSFVVLRLAPWSERKLSAAEIVRKIVPRMGDVTVAKGFPVTPAGLGLRGNSTPVRIVIGGPDFDSVKEWAATILAKAEENSRLVNPEIDFEENLPQLDVTIDRARADDLGISVETIASTLQTMLASREVTTFVSRGREYPVLVQAGDEDRRVPSDIGNIFVRAGDGKTLVPLGALVQLRENAAAPSLRRYDRLPSIQLSAALDDGYDLGTALTYLEDAARESLPPEAKLGYEGQSRTFKDTSAGASFVFAMALLIVFLRKRRRRLWQPR